MDGYAIYQGKAKIKSIADEEQTEQKTTSEQNRNIENAK